MFWHLHRAVQALFWCFWLAAAFVVFQHRHALEPVWDITAMAWRHDWAGGRELPPIEGRVTQIHAGETFTLRHETGVLYYLALAGVTAPRAVADPTPDERRLAGSSHTNLMRLALNQRLRVSLYQFNPETRAGWALASAGTNQLNEAVLRSGWARLNREQLRWIPFATSVKLYLAEREARRTKAGLWGELPALEGGLAPITEGR